MSHYVYILESKDGRLYTGYTTDLKRRLKEHQTGKGAKFTAAFGAVSIKHSECFHSKSEALKREYEIKSMSRSQKIELLNSS